LRGGRERLGRLIEGVRSVGEHPSLASLNFVETSSDMTNVRLIRVI
jgi:hypothetical protein